MCPPSCTADARCYIIPPHLLEAISNAATAPSETRDAARRTLHQTSSAREHRRAHTASLQAHYSSADTSASHESSAAANSNEHGRSSFVPDHLLQNIVQAEGADTQSRESAARTLDVNKQVRTGRTQDVSVQGHLWREVYDSVHVEDSSLLPRILKRAENEPTTTANKDPDVDSCYNNLGRTFNFFWEIFKRNSINGRGMSLIGNIHFDKNLGNAFWDGKQMVFGDGDGKFLGNFVNSLDVIGHELTHGITQYTAQLQYHDEPGALNESMSDVFGSLVKQYCANETADQADWLIDPGTAYDAEVIGKDPQVAHMKDYIDTDKDNGGVHWNSGIPNKAFYLVSTSFGGKAWETAGHIWYNALLDKRMRPDIGFKRFAEITCLVARRDFSKANENVVRKAWIGVGVIKESDPSPVN